MFALNYGFEIMKEIKIETQTVRAGNANLFLSPLFRQIFVDVTQSELQLVDSNRSLGAAVGGAIGLGKIKHSDWQSRLEPMVNISPDTKRSAWYAELYKGWKTKLDLI